MNVEKPFEPFYYGEESGVERRIEERWNENTGFEITEEFFASKPTLERVRDEAVRCGYTDATLSQVSPGSAIWTLSLKYKGRDAPFSRLFQPQIEEQSTHWLIQGRYEKLPLWRSPIYSPLITCQVEIGNRQVEEITKHLPPRSWAYQTASGETGIRVTPPEQPQVEGTDPDQNYTFYISKNDPISGVTGTRPVFTDIRFPYSRILQISAQTWRQAIEGQITNTTRDIMVNLRDAAAARAALQLDGTPRRINLTEQFDVRKHLVTHVQQDIVGPSPANSYDVFSLLPFRTFSDVEGGYWTQEQLIDMAQDFANSILARIDTYDYSRQTIVNERIVSIRSGMNASYQGVNKLWSAHQIAQLIRLQLEYRRRAFALEGSPSQCTERDKTMEQVIFLLEGDLSKRLFLKRPPTTRTSGRGNLQVRQEWEERFTWEVDRRINKDFTAELDEIIWIPAGYDTPDESIETTPPEDAA